MSIVKLLLAGLFISTLLFTMDIQADYVYLNDGSTISGVLLKEKEKLLIYRVAYGEMFISRENITTIIHEPPDIPLLREAEKYLKDKKFKRAIKTCGEALEINPDSREALKLKQRAVDAWRRYEAKPEERIKPRPKREVAIEKKPPPAEKKDEQRPSEFKNMAEQLKTKWGIAIRKEKNNYIIADVYQNCPIVNGYIKPEDTLIAIHKTRITILSLKKVYNLLLTSKKITLTIQRPVTLIREKIRWHKTKAYVGLGMSIERVDNGVEIIDLMQDGPAAKAELLKYDIITSLGGFRVSSFSMDKIIKGSASAGTSLKVVIERDVTLE